MTLIAAVSAHCIYGELISLTGVDLSAPNGRYSDMEIFVSICIQSGCMKIP
jgi:hypothetical protein